MKHISSRGPYLSKPSLLLSPFKSSSSLHLWNYAPIFILVFSLALSNLFFLHCFYSSVFFIWCGQWWRMFLLCCLSTIVHSLSLNLNQVRADAAPVWGRSTAQYTLREGGGLPTMHAMIDTPQTLPLALIGCVDLGAVDSCKSTSSHWVEPQTVDLYTADLYLILPS